MKSTLLFALLVLAAQGAHAEIYKSVDENGNVTYSNIPTRGAKKLNIEPLTTVPRPRADFKVDSRTQKMRDDTRYSILNEELNAEMGRLEKSRQEALKAGSDAALARRLQEEMVLHEKNIEALKKEISNLK